MLTNTNVVDSTSDKTCFVCFFIQDKCQRASNVVFAVFVGEKNLQMTLTLNLQEGKDVFWKTDS